MLRIGLALVLLGLVGLAGRWLYRALASDETRIRWALAGAAAGFGDARMDPILAVLARDFRDETSGFAREDVRAAIAAAFFQEKDPRTRGFPYRALLDLDGATIALERGDRDSAAIEVAGRIVDTRGETKREAWSFRLRARMEERDQGWCLVAAEHETTSGSWRLRAR